MFYAATFGVLLLAIISIVIIYNLNMFGQVDYTS